MAERFLRRFESRLRQVLRLPLSGASRRELAPDLRVVFCGKYAIYYLPRRGEIVVVPVLHGSRNLEAITDEGGFAL